MIACAEAVRQLWEYLEEDLDEANRQEVEQHLAFCRRCCGELEFAEELKRFIAQAPKPDLPPVIEARLHGFLTELEEERAP